jgi:hypothetical protein
MFMINLFPILIEYLEFFRVIVQKYSRLYCHPFINKKIDNCPSCCFKMKYFFIGRRKTYNELVYERVADYLNFKIIEKRVAFAENHEKKIIYN